MSSEALLRMERITKSFPGVRALRDVDFDLCEGEVHALVGENGAGKSTLVKVLAGVYRPDSGRILLRGSHLQPRGPRDMMDAGIRVIYQELNLAANLSVAENLFLGREPLRRGIPGVIDWPMMHRRTAEALKQFDLAIDPRVRVSTLGVAYQQIIEIAKAVSFDAAVVVMDEPTAALTQREAERLFAIIETLKRRGVSVIYISHRLDEIRRVANRVTVLRDGQRITTAPADELPADEIIRLMVGRSVAEQYPKESLPLGEVLLEVEGLSREGVCHDVSFQLRRGEILGIAGLAGAGRTEIVEMLFGRRRPDRGTIRLLGRAIKVRSPRDAVRQGLGLIPEERKTHGLVLDLSVFDNVALPVLKRYSVGGWIRRARLVRQADDVLGELRIKAASPSRRVKFLSGGNQQKVVLAKWLLCGCRVYLFDEPTRGVDVAAKSEIYRLIENLARQGAGIIMVSSDLPEVLNMSDRILVVRAGRIVDRLRRDEATQEAVLRGAVGGEAVKEYRRS